MKFGEIENPEKIDFSIPLDHPTTKNTLQKNNNRELSIYIGCPKWSRKDLQGFYPPGVKNELEYYSSQFNAIELNTTFYRMYSGEQFSSWYDKTPPGFKFYPKLYKNISHVQRLDSSVFPTVEKFLSSVNHLKEKLGSIFLQLPDNFSPKYFNRVQDFVKTWPKQFSLAIEFRHKDWFSDSHTVEELYSLFHENNIANVIVDTAGRRDMMHMRLTNHEAFIRYVGANLPSDYNRLDDWVDRVVAWHNQGLSKLHFFVHQHLETELPALAAHFIEKLNSKLNLQLQVPNITVESSQGSLF